MSTRKKRILFGSLAVTLTVITWMLAHAAQKHDGWILGKLSDEFAHDAPLDNVQVAVGGGVVSLRGSVALLEDKRQAVRKATNTDHVSTVKDYVVVKTRWVPDGTLRMQLNHDLRSHELGALRLKVRKGVVTVRGPMPSSRERVLSLIASTEGVLDIRDQMTAAK